VKCHLLETADTVYSRTEEPYWAVSELALLISLGKTLSAKSSSMEWQYIGTWTFPWWLNQSHFLISCLQCVRYRTVSNVMFL